MRHWNTSNTPAVHVDHVHLAAVRNSQGFWNSFRVLSMAPKNFTPKATTGHSRHSGGKIQPSPHRGTLTSVPCELKAILKQMWLMTRMLRNTVGKCSRILRLPGFQTLKIMACSAGSSWCGVEKSPQCSNSIHLHFQPF